MTEEGTKTAKAAKAAKPDPKALLLDVAKFASKLGFGSSAGGADNAFDDFAPAKAKQPIAKKAKVDKKRGGDAMAPTADEASPTASKPKLLKNKNKKGKSEDGSEAEKDAGGGGPAAHRQKPVDAKVKERDWNFGVGPRPGAFLSEIPFCRPCRP